MARPSSDVVTICSGNVRRSSGSAGPSSAYRARYHAVAERAPSTGWMMPGRIMYAARNGSPRSAFSVRPFTRAHIARPRSVASVPCPDT
jgi:hypothetical protein